MSTWPRPSSGSTAKPAPNRLTTRPVTGWVGDSCALAAANADQAAGIEMSQRGATSSHALASLKRMSQSGNVALAVMV